MQTFTYLLTLAIVFQIGISAQDQPTESDSATTTTTKRTTTPRPPRFDNQCGRVQRYEKAFSGQCRLIDENVYPQILEFVKLAKSSEPDSMSLDEFLRQIAFKDFTAYFRKKYEARAEFIQVVDELTTQIDVVLDKLKKSISGVTVMEVYEPFEKSGFSKIALQVSQETDKLVLDELGGVDSNSTYICKNDANFCATTQKLIGNRFINEITAKSLQEFLSDFNNNVLNTLVQMFEKNIILINLYKNQKLRVDELIGKLVESGSESVPLSEFNEVVETAYIRDGLYLYESISRVTNIYGSRPTTTTVMRTTALRVKKTTQVAVSNFVVAFFPALILGLGFAFGIAIIGFVYRFKTVPTHFDRVSAETPIVETYTNQMEMQQGKNFVRF